MSDQFFELKEKSQRKNQPKQTKLNFVNKYIILFVILILIGGLAYFFILDDYEYEVNVSFTDNTEDTHNHYIKLGEYIVNLKHQGNDHYVKMVLVLKIEDSQDKVVIEERMLNIRDVIQTFLKDLRVVDFNGAAGSIRLKTELLKRINNVIKPQNVQEVLIQEFLIN